MNWRAFAFLLLGLAVLACEQRPAANKPKPPSTDSLVARLLAQDSGYLTKREGLPLLLKLGLADTVDSLVRETMRLFKATDTVGKFYPSQNGRLVLCEAFSWESYYGSHYDLFEVSYAGQLIQHRRYFLGNGACAVRDFLTGFRKVGPWFLLTCNDTGSGFCAGYTRVFDQQLPPVTDGGVWSSLYYSLMPYEGCFPIIRLSSRLAFSHDTLLMHYVHQETDEDENDKVLDESTEQFTVRYTKRDSIWRAVDSTRLKPLIQWLK